MKKTPLALDPTSSTMPISSKIAGALSLTNMRPPSSLSNFDLIDDTNAPTPFELTPSTSPIKKPSIDLPNTQNPTHEDEDEDVMPTEQIDPFHGDKEDKNPEDFLRSFFRRMGTASNDVRKQQFKYFLQADSAADEWFEELPLTDKKDWDAIEQAFNQRWPRKKAAKKTTEEYEEEITGLQLKMEDMGKKEKTGGREIYSHIAWADKMATIVKGAKLETTTTYIGHVRKELPQMLKDKVGVAHKDWAAFLQAVHDVDLEHIKDRVNTWKKEQEEKDVLRKRIQQLEKLTASPTAPLRQQMTTFGMGNPPASAIQQRQSTAAPANPFMSATGGCGNLFQAPQTATTPQNATTRPPATQADRAALLVRLQKYPHHPDTDAGRQAHQAQQAEWAKVHGPNAFVTESTPYPLRPGTLPVGSGECFTCGFTGHMGRRDASTCGNNRALHAHEQTWRAIAARILRQTRNATNIQLVAVDDYGTTWQDVQGNEDGPSN